ncbi:hypothetical protein YYC_05577 [Plasmodium yoelii 17X]|uniref:Uncharacterized protein n=1 Tax=Plasmodium yoelii 17X TaxID=1323249 RepID=V7PCD2_PLAYE|nr:hypothetical protein YYC_05577 [Plasmodium yoelii 17X]
MKNVINLFGVNKTTKTVINSKIKKSINSIYGEISPLLNIYKLMQSDPKRRFFGMINLINLYLKFNLKNV